MTRSLNKVMLIGNIGSEPEIRATSSGARVAKLSLATNRAFQDRSGEQQERTDWHRLTFFGKLADVVEQWVHKGDRLYVEGRIEYSQTQDDKGGTRYWTDVVVQEMVMLGAGGSGDSDADPGSRGRRATAGARETKAPPLSEPDDDLPF